jgi:ketosteroid isomerase-like protein
MRIRFIKADFTKSKSRATAVCKPGTAFSDLLLCPITVHSSQGPDFMCRLFHTSVLLAAFLFTGIGHAQFGMPSANPPSNATSLLTDPTDSPGLHFLYDLERKFALATAEGGGPAFASWFAENAVSLANGKPPVQGHDAIAAQARWSAKDYQLTWTPDGGALAPGGDMGYTWGHYTGHAKDAQGSPIVTTGRYMTIWQKQSDGAWKVVLDASNEGPALDCCKVP